MVEGGAIRAKYDSTTGAGDRDELFDKDTEKALNETKEFRGQQIIGARRRYGCLWRYLECSPNSAFDFTEEEKAHQRAVCPSLPSPPYAQ